MYGINIHVRICIRTSKSTINDYVYIIIHYGLLVSTHVLVSDVHAEVGELFGEGRGQARGVQDLHGKDKGKATRSECTEWRVWRPHNYFFLLCMTEYCMSRSTYM